MYFYGLIIGIAIALGISYFQSHNKIVPKNRETFFIFGTIFSAIIGARLYHVIDQWSYYSQNISQIFQTWNGGLGIFGGLTGGLVFIILFSLFFRLSILKILDFITPILPLSQAIGRLGNFFNQEIPIWWLESVLCLLLFLFIRANALKRHNSTALYLIGYGLIRFITEFFRTDTWIIENIKIGQFISLLFIVVGLVLLSKKYSNLK